MSNRTRYFNGVAFKWNGVRLLGRLESELVLNPGMTADVCQLLVPRTVFEPLLQFDPVEGTVSLAIAGEGDLEFFFFSDPTISGVGADFVLRNWFVYNVEETRWAAIRGQDGSIGTAQAVEIRLTLIDRRRRFRAGRGGALFGGMYNPSQPDGQPIHNADGSLRFSLFDAISQCLNAMAIDLSVGTGDPDDPGEALPVSLKSVEAPRDLNWDGAHAPTELEKLLALAGIALCITKAGTPVLHVINPDLQFHRIGSVFGTDGTDDFELPFIEVKAPEDRPQKVIITSAPTYVANEVTLTGPDPTQIDYVGEQIDPTSGKPSAPLPLTGLTNWGGDLNRLKKLVQVGYDAAASQPDISSALKSVYRWLKVSHSLMYEIPNTPTPEGNKPILTRALDAVNSGPTTEGGLTVRYPRLRTKSRFQTGSGWVNPTALVETPFVIADPKTGLIRVHDLVGTVSPNNASHGAQGFAPLASGGIEFTFCQEKRTGHPWEKFYMSIWSIDNNGQLQQHQISEIEATLADPDVLIISVPELRLYRNSTGDLNRAPLDALAGQYANAALTQGQRQTAIRRFRGFHAFMPSGLISSVHIAQDGLLTTVEVNRHRLPGSRYNDEAAAKAIKDSSEKTQRSRTSAEANNAGTRDNAKIEPPSPPPPQQQQQTWFAIIDGSTGNPPQYDFHEVLNAAGTVAGPRTNASTGKKIINFGDFAGRRNPDGTSASVTYPPLPAGTRVEVRGFSAIDDAWYIDVTPQPMRRNDC